MALVEALKDLYVSIVGRDDQPLTVEARPNPTATEPVKLKPGTAPTHLLFKPFADQSGDVRVLFPDSGDRGLFVRANGSVELRPTTPDPNVEAGRFRFKVEPATDGSSCFRLQSMFDKKPFIKRLNADSTEFGLVDKEKDAQLFCLTAKPKEVAYVPKQNIESAPNPSTGLSYDRRYVASVPVANGDAYVSEWIHDDKLVLVDPSNETPRMIAGRFNFEFVRPPKSAARGDVIGTNEWVTVIGYKPGSTTPYVLYNPPAINELAFLSPPYLAAAKADDDEDKLLRQQWKLEQVGSSGKYRLLSRHSTNQYVGSDAGWAKGYTNLLGRIAVNQAVDLEFEFRSAAEQNTNTEIATGPGQPNQAVNQLKYGVPYLWVPDISPTSVFTVNKQPIEKSDVRLQPAEQAGNAANRAVFVYVNPLDPKSVGTPLRSDGLSYIVVGTTNGSSRYFLYNGDRDSFVTAVPLDKFIQVGHTKQRGSWKVSESSAGKFRIDSLKHNVVEKRSGDTAVVKEPLSAVKADGNTAVAGSVRLGAPDPGNASETETIVKSPLLMQHLPYTGKPFEFDPPIGVFPIASSWTPAEIEGNFPTDESFLDLVVNTVKGWLGFIAVGYLGAIVLGILALLLVLKFVA